MWRTGPEQGQGGLPLAGLRVVELSTGIAGGYATKLFADAGADVVKVEPPDGDPLRRWTASGADPGSGTGVVFGFLAAAKRSVVGDFSDPAVLALVGSADLVVESGPPSVLETGDLFERFRHLVLLTVSPYGLTGPWRDRPATEFTLQAAGGSTASRGWPGGDPIAIGGRVGEWAAGVYGATAALAAIRRAERTGHGGHIDLSMLECVTTVSTNYADLFASIGGRPPLTAPPRLVETPSIEPTADGRVGFAILTPQQYADFCVLVERPDLSDDEELRQLVGRILRRDEWSAIVQSWTRRHTTAEVLEQASTFRIPVGPVTNGETVQSEPHLVDREFFASTDEGVAFPKTPYLVDGERPPTGCGAPALGADTAILERRDPAPRITPAPTGQDGELPLAGLRVLEITSFWAGPIAGFHLGALGAEVIRVESVQRPDGFRLVLPPGFPMGDRWWEFGPGWLAGNGNKRSVTLDLGRPEGLAGVKRLIADADILIENYSPRVMENFGLGWDTIRAINDHVVMVRMPAFGLEGPWRDRGAFAQIAEGYSGMSWVTGEGDEPINPRGPADHMGGLHAVFAMLAARRAVETGRPGALVEVPLVEAALNITAAQVLEFTAYGRLVGRHGNRSLDAAPQGLYRCGGGDQRLALSVTTDGEWEALVTVLGKPAWATAGALATAEGRHANHDLIDDELRVWATGRELEATVDELTTHGIPAAAVADPRSISGHPQLVARGFVEPVEHPVAGRHAMFGLPYRMTGVDAWYRTPAPTLGQHNAEVLQEAGLTVEEIADLAAHDVIGVRPLGLER